MYADDTDTWTVKHYNKLGYSVNAFVRRGQICAAVNDKCRMQNCDDEGNVWTTEHKSIENKSCIDVHCVINNMSCIDLHCVINNKS